MRLTRVGSLLHGRSLRSWTTAAVRVRQIDSIQRALSLASSVALASLRAADFLPGLPQRLKPHLSITAASIVIRARVASGRRVCTQVRAVAGTALAAVAL